MGRVAITADIHLEGLRNILRGDTVGPQIEALRRLLRSMLQHQIYDLIVAGDLFDHAHPSEETKFALAGLMLRCPRIHWHIKPGNHDRPLIDQHSMKLLEWLSATALVQNVSIYLEPQLATIGGMPLWMCPHPYIEPQPPEALYAIGHFAWAGARRDNGSVEAKGSSPAGRWVLGDFHKPQAGPRYHYVGSLTQVEWIESGTRGYSILYTDQEGTPRLSRRRIEAPYQLSVLPVETLDALDWLYDYREEKQHWWKLLVPPGLSLPDDWQSLYPQVLSRAPLGRAEKASAAVERVQLSDDPFEGLDDWLDERKNLTPAQISWSVAYLEALRGVL